MATNNKTRGRAMKKWLTIIFVVSVMLFICWELVGTIKESQEHVPVRVENMMQATDFKLPTFDGKKISLQEQHGKIVILNFWASWCEPCRIEMPHFQTFYEEYNQDIEILAVNVTRKDKMKNVGAFVDEYDLTFPILLDTSGEISTIYGAFALPATIIIDREGNIAREILGPMDEALLLKYVEPLL